MNDNYALKRQALRRHLFGGALILVGALSAGFVAAESRIDNVFDSPVVWAQLKVHGGHDPARQRAIGRLATAVNQRTTIVMHSTPTIVTLDDKRLFDQPLLFLNGGQSFRMPDRQGVAKLRRFLVSGGFLLIDNAEARPSGGFDRSARKLVRRLFPRIRMSRIPTSHTVYQSFYLLKKAVGRVALTPHVDGISYESRLVLLYSQNDLAGAWARDDFGQWDYNVYPGGDKQREMAFRWGINIAMYALCLDYKSDQVHLPALLRRRLSPPKP